MDISFTDTELTLYADAELALYTKPNSLILLEEALGELISIPDIFIADEDRAQRMALLKKQIAEQLGE